VEQPEVDETLLEKIALRNDIPLHIFPSSFGASYPGSAKAYLALATPGKRDDIANLLASIRNEVIENEELDDDFAAAQVLSS
jgi:hypothetical protein